MLVVARLLDGGKVKGRSTDFHPEQDHFTIAPADTSLPVRIPVAELKALFFVRSLDGNPERQDHREFRLKHGVRSKLWLEFQDGERMAAWPVSPTMGKQGFYVLPTDSDSNVEKAWVYRPALKKVLQGEEADRASKRWASRDLMKRPDSSATWPRVVRLR